MSENIVHQGACLCGKITFSARQTAPASACHCHMCRRHHGAAFYSVFCTDFTLLQGRECLHEHASSPWARRGFCENCGSTLFWRGKTTRRPNTNMQKSTAILLGVFDERQPLPLEAHIFTEDASGAYPLPRE